MSAAKTKNEKIMALLNKKLKQKPSDTSNDDIQVLTTTRTDAVASSSVVGTDVPSTSSEPSAPTEEERKLALRKKAKEKLLFEAKRARDRADQFGPQGWFVQNNQKDKMWLKPKSLNTNKEFLRRTIQSTVSRKDKKKEQSKTS